MKTSAVLLGRPPKVALVKAVPIKAVPIKVKPCPEARKAFVSRLTRLGFSKTEATDLWRRKT